METIGFLGTGNMAEALIKGIIGAGLYAPENIFISDVRRERLELLAREYRVRPAETNAELARNADILVLSVKPQNMAEALNSIKDAAKKSVLVISIAAGIRIAAITAILGEVAVVRVMPNTPALIGEGASALFANDRARPVLDSAEKIFAAVGRTVVVDDEDLIDVVTAVSGSGPAYYFLLMEEMTKAAVKLGLSADVANELVLQTAKGAALLAAEAAGKGEGLAELRRKVASPGGTTEAAVKVLAEGGFGPLVAGAIRQAWARSRELSK